MAVFGTSGLRGPATDFTQELCTAYVTAFLERCAPQSSVKTVYVGADLRDSSGRIASQTLAAIKAADWTPVWAGYVPTPALASYAMSRSVPAVMITGSHIPETYNGIKFYRPDGEFLKEDETPVKQRAAAIIAEGRAVTPIELIDPLADVANYYVQRFVGAFGADALAGFRIGIDLHSAVGRDLTFTIFQRLGADCHAFNRQDRFIAVDTEALDPEDIARARRLIDAKRLDAVVSTDGDGDRPLVIDQKGHQIHGDVLGLLTAKLIGAKTVVTPLSSTGAVEETGWFNTVVRTRIGSPFVVSGMARAKDHPVVGFEANGGFLLGDDVALSGGILTQLPTRDAILPAVACMVLARQLNLSLSALAATLPPRFMKADRVKDVAPSKGKVFLNKMEMSANFRTDFDARLAGPRSISVLDGVRMVLADGDTVHFRQSGNAPEMRVYVETRSVAATENLLTQMVARLISYLGDK